MPDKGLTRRGLLGGAMAGGVASLATGNLDIKPAHAAGGRTSVAPADLLRASAITTTGDPWLPDGSHLRVDMSPRLGFPLHPFTAFRVDVIASISSGLSPLQTVNDHVWLNPDLTVRSYGGSLVHTGTGDVHYLVLQRWQDPFRSLRCCYVRLRTTTGSAMRIDVLDPACDLPDAEPRVLATRTAAPYEFGGTDIALLRVTGYGTVDLIQYVSTESPYITANPAQAVTFGLPIDAGPWYTQEPDINPVLAARTRVEQGAAKRMGPPDRPDGSVVPLTAADEVARVQALAGLSSGGLNYWLTRAFTDALKPPPDARVDLGGGTVSDAAGSVGPLNALFTAAADPAVARHLGLATRVAPPSLEAECTLWLIAGLWLLPMDRTHETGTLRALLNGYPPPANITSTLYTRFPGLSTLAAQRVTQLRAAQPADGWAAVPLMTAALAAKNAPDRPAAPNYLVPPQPEWRASAGEPRWSQRIPLQGPVPGMLGLARLTPTPVSLHGTIRVGSVDRARAMVVHWDKHDNGSGGVTDLAVTDAKQTWGLWRADEFGRWSDRTMVSASAPPVAGPPTPSVEAEFQPAAPDPDRQPRSPGMLRIRVGVPGPTTPGPLPSRPVTTPGGAPVAFARVTVDGTPQPEIAVPAGATSVTLTVAVRPFGVADSSAIPITAVLVDTALRTSASAGIERIVHDPRSYAPLGTAPTLLFTAGRDPMGDSELALEWSARGAWAYRVYLGDERRLGGTGTGPRHERAADVWSRREQLTDRRRFALVTAQPLHAGPDGVVRFTHPLPGSLRGVQFVRVVPVTGTGVETAFETCGLTPVAVPSVDRPPAPLVRVTRRTDGRADVTITARGLHFPDSANPPEARLRRGRAANDDPEYVPVVQAGIPLTRAADDSWTATVIDGPAGGFPAYVRVTWLAELRYPAEPERAAGLPAAASDVLPVAGITPGPQPSGWGPSSPPASTLLTPEIQLVPRATVRSVPPYWDIIVTNTPVSNPYAISPYLVVVHRYFGGTAASVALPAVPITGTTTTVHDRTPASRPLAYIVSIVDPFRRATPPLYVPF